MFTEASKMIGECLCAIKDPKDQCQKEILGQGCMLTDRIVLTAHSVVKMVKNLEAIPVSCPSGVWNATEVWSEPDADLALLQLDLGTPGAPRNPAPPRFPRISGTGLHMGTQVGYMGLLSTWEHKETAEFLPPTFFSGCVSRRDREGKYPNHYLTPNYSVMSFGGSPAFFPDGALCGVFLGSVHIITKFLSTCEPRHLNEFHFLFPCVSPLAPHQKAIEAFTRPKAT